MADSTLTKKDVFNFLNLGRKIVISGTGAVLNGAKSKIAELTDSEEALQRRISTQVKALVGSGFSPEEAYKAVSGRMKDRVDRVIEKFANLSGDSSEKK